MARKLPYHINREEEIKHYARLVRISSMSRGFNLLRESRAIREYASVLPDPAERSRVWGTIMRTYMRQRVSYY